MASKKQLKTIRGKKQIGTQAKTVKTLALSSSWKCHLLDDGSYGWEQDPSSETDYLTFEYSIPSGSTIKSAKIRYEINSPASGISIFTINGISGKKSGRVEFNLTGTTGNFMVAFTFRANGTKEDENTHKSTLQLKNIRLEIEYIPPKTVKPQKNPKISAKDFPHPKQTTYFITQSDGRVFEFDGVTKIQHSLSSKFEEEPSENKDEYVNGARNEPDKVTIDVMMSDVYTSTGTLTDGRPTTRENSRSAAALSTLHDIKTDRVLLMVVTPQYVYTDMVLASVTANQDENTQFGFEAQLTFQHKYNTDSGDDVTSSSGGSGEEEDPDPRGPNSAAGETLDKWRQNRVT